jgi:hypothetical protein
MTERPRCVRRGSEDDHRQLPGGWSARSEPSCASASGCRGLRTVPPRGTSRMGGVRPAVPDLVTGKVPRLAAGQRDTGWRAAGDGRGLARAVSLLNALALVGAQGQPGRCCAAICPQTPLCSPRPPRRPAPPPGSGLTRFRANLYRQFGLDDFVLADALYRQGMGSTCTFLTGHPDYHPDPLRAAATLAVPCRRRVRRLVWPVSISLTGCPVARSHTRTV